MFDPTKPVRTRDGRPARIIATDRKGNYSIVALAGESDSILLLTSEGKFPFFREESKHDLVNYDPFEITDEEAELIIDLYGSAINQKLSKSFKKDVRDRNWVAVNSICRRFRDIIIKHRKTK